MNWYLEVLKKYAVFSGRARRKEYWMFFLFNTIIGFVLGLIEGIAGTPHRAIRASSQRYTCLRFFFRGWLSRSGGFTIPDGADGGCSSRLFHSSGR